MLGIQRGLIRAMENNVRRHYSGHLLAQIEQLQATDTPRLLRTDESRSVSESVSIEGDPVGIIGRATVA